MTACPDDQQWPKILYSILVTIGEITSSFKPVQELKSKVPISITEEGTIIFFNDL